MTPLFNPYYACIVGLLIGLGTILKNSLSSKQTQTKLTSKGTKYDNCLDIKYLSEG